ncbi:hypothetical protein SALBM311S_08694 [Streptomyces alboniger]
MKLSYLRKNYGGRVTTHATATPVDNPMEILTAIKYLAPDLLRDEWGIESAVRLHHQPVNRVEMSPDATHHSRPLRPLRQPDRLNAYCSRSPTSNSSAISSSANPPSSAARCGSWKPRPLRNCASSCSRWASG